MSLSAPRVLVAVIAATGALAACGGGEPATSEEPLEALCRAASADDVDTARELFEGRPHLELHDLADALTEADARPVAGDLLEAKNQVEAAFSTEPVPDDLGDRFDFLLGAVERSLDVLGRPPLTCTD